MTKYCIKCGNPCPDDALLCPRCGEMLQRNAAPGNNIKKANTVMLAQKQPFIQRVRNSSLVESPCAENVRG